MKYHWITPTGEMGNEAENQRIIIRADGRVEQLCDHGVGHPIGHTKKWVENWMSVHGCDGCCNLAAFALEALGKRKVEE